MGLDSNEIPREYRKAARRSQARTPPLPRPKPEFDAVLSAPEGSAPADRACGCGPN